RSVLLLQILRHISKKSLISNIMIPGSKAPKAVRACTKGFELGTRKNMRMQRFSKKISESECF
ncbi:MAG: hypothetical protein SO186_05255, partial [Lachnospiraceae bacterium]|nr:hypothetical protein [Lachnospiraceae bacterium]